MDEEVKFALCKFSNLNFEGLPQQIQAIVDLANQCPFPPVILEIYNRIFYLFQKDSKGRSYPNRSALVQLAYDLSYLLPRLDSTTDPLRFSVHLITAFDHSDPEVWILAYQLIRACSLILGECSEYFHFVTLGFFRSQQEVIAAAKLSQYLIQTSTLYPSYFIDWTSDHFWDLSHACQRSVLKVMSHAQTTCLVLVQMKSLCRDLLNGPNELSSDSTTSILSPFHTNDSQLNSRNGTECHQRLTTWLNALILISITKSLSPTPEDMLHVTKAVESDYETRNTRNSTRSTILLVHALRTIVRFPKWLVMRYESNQQDLSRWLQHPHTRVRSIAYVLIIRICKYPNNRTQSQLKEILARQVSFELLSRTDLNDGIVIPEQCRAILAMTNHHFYNPVQVFEYAWNKLKLGLESALFETNQNVSHVRGLINILAGLSVPMTSFWGQLSTYLLEQIFRNQIPLPIRSLLAQLYARFKIDARIDVEDGNREGSENDFLLIVNMLAKTGSLTPSDSDPSNRCWEQIQFHVLRPWLMDPNAATSVIAFKSSLGDSFPSGSLVGIVCRWSAYRLCIEALTSQSTALQWFDVAYTTLTDLSLQVSIYSHFAWLHHLSCVAKAYILNSVSVLDECQQSARVTWLMESKAYIDRNLGESSFQSSLLRVDGLFDEVLGTARFQWLPNWGHISDSMIQIADDYLFLTRMFPEMNGLSRKVLQRRSESCMMVAEWLKNETRPIDDSSVVSSIMSAMRVLPVCYLATESMWELKVLVTPSSSSQRPIHVNDGVDVTYHVYGQILHHLDQKSMPVITEGQLITVLSLKPQMIAMKRDMRKQRRVLELVTCQSDEFQTELMSQLGIIHFSASPLALHTNAFTKLGAIPYSVFDEPKDEPGVLQRGTTRSGLGNQHESRSSTISTIYATLLVRLKLPESFGGEWWECGPVLGMVIQLCKS